MCWYHNLSPSFTFSYMFHNLNLPINIIFSYSRLKLGHNLLPSHGFHLSVLRISFLNSIPYSSLHDNEAKCDISDLLFDFLALHSSRTALFNLRISHNIHNPSATNILNSRSAVITQAVISFVKSFGLYN